MYELKISVAKVLGECTADPPMTPGQYITVHDGSIRIPEGSFFCVWALHNVLPLVPAKEREIAEDKDEDWMWRVHHVQCPDPKGRVVLQIDRLGKVQETTALPCETDAPEMFEPEESTEGPLSNLRVVVDEVGGRCTSGMTPGDYFLVRRGRLYVPANRHFCIYALQAALPFLAAKQRTLQDGDWLKEESRFICPDPAGNVILRIDKEGANEG
jgi:uncharacterized repeat protein (TIGR04076 family)